MKIIKTVNPKVANKISDLGFAYTIENLRIGNDSRTVFTFCLDEEDVKQIVSQFSAFAGCDFFVGETLSF